MNKKDELIKQIEIVITKLENEYNNEISDGILQLIYKRYMDALSILKSDKDIKKVNIIGGVRAYMDSYNDYNNPILGEMYKAEKLIKDVKW